MSLLVERAEFFLDREESMPERMAIPRVPSMDGCQLW